MPNRFTKKTPFKLSTLVFQGIQVNLIRLSLSQDVNPNAKEFVESNLHYKIVANRHRCTKLFNEGDLVMVHLHKNRFPTDNACKIDFPANMNLSNTFNVVNTFEYFPQMSFLQPQNSRMSFLQVKGLIQHIIIISSYFKFIISFLYH
ncbi:hypothetical protein AAG906_025242 [Vitis piasezkii]